jgi:hypothetical protein
MLRLLKGQCHEIFFRQSITPRPLINTLKYFPILFRKKTEGGKSRDTVPLTCGILLFIYIYIKRRFCIINVKIHAQTVKAMYPWLFDCPEALKYDEKATNFPSRPPVFFHRVIKIIC